MPLKPDPETGEFAYGDYQARQFRETQQEGLEERILNIHYGEKFRFRNQHWELLPYKGYAVLSMLSNNPGNEGLSEKLRLIQEYIISTSGLEKKLYPLPEESFHQTIANTLSGIRFSQNIGDKGLEPVYPEIIKKAFQKILPSPYFTPIKMKLIGVGIFGTAMGILGIFEAEKDFERILNFRSQFYEDTDLNTYNIKRTRPFVGHLTLLYFNEDIRQEDGPQLMKSCIAINQEIQRENLVFNISNAQLLQYEHLSQFHFHHNFPTYSFTAV